MVAFDLANLSGLVDEAKCFALVRQHRWPEGVRCAVCGSGAAILAKPKVCAGTAMTTRSPAASAIAARRARGASTI